MLLLVFIHEMENICNENQNIFCFIVYIKVRDELFIFPGRWLISLLVVSMYFIGHFSEVLLYTFSESKSEILVLVKFCEADMLAEIVAFWH